MFKGDALYEEALADIYAVWCCIFIELCARLSYSRKSDRQYMLCCPAADYATSGWSKLSGEIYMAFKDKTHAKAYWQENIKLMLILLSIWFFVSFGCGILLVDVLNQVQLGGYKLGFWFAQQGSMYTFVVLIFVYAKKMTSLDRKYGVEED